MKAAPFDYTRAGSLAEACDLLEQYGDDAKVIAGGQSLVPMLAMRLLAPAWLIDIGRVAALQEIGGEAGQMVIGATVRQSAALANDALAHKVPLLRKALKWVGHAATRNRGTIGGSLVHADPAAELPLVAALLGATFSLHSTRGIRRVGANEFFTGPMMTSIEPDECLVDIRFPVWDAARTGSGFVEIASRHGDFAIVATAAQITLDADGVCTRAALAIGGAGPAPHVFPALAARMVGSRLDDRLLRELAHDAAAQLEPTNDLQASAAYRRHLAGVLAERVLRSAREEAIN